MAPPQIPYIVRSVLTFPPDDGVAPTERAAQYAGNYTKSACHKLTLTGTGTHAVGFGTVVTPGAKGFLIEYNNDDAQGGLQPIEVTINGGDEPLEVSPGGHISFSSPAPVAGVLSMSIAHTSDARVNIWILG